MATNTKKFCRVCGHFIELYSKYMAGFIKVHRGVCNLTESESSPSGTCENWKAKPRQKHSIPIERFDKAIGDIEYLLSIFED